MRLAEQSLPPGWAICRFGDVASIANGMVNPTTNEFQNLKHIGPENIESDSGRILDLKTSRELRLISGKYFFDEYSVLYSKIRPNLNKVCIPRFRGLCSADMYPIWTVSELVDREFLFYVMTSAAFLSQSVPMSMRTGMPKINREDLNGIKLLVPPLSEQKTIVQLLSAWGRAIAATEKLRDAKHTTMRSLLRQLVSDQRTSWHEQKLGELFKHRKKKGAEGLPTYSVTMDNGLVLRESLDRKNDTSLRPEEHLLVEKDDLAYNMMRMWQGASGLAPEPGLVSPAYVVLRSRGEIDPLFASYWFKTPRVIKKFQDYSHGLTKDRLRLYYKDFASITLPVPPLDLQRKIARTLAACDRELDLLRRKLDLLKQQKKGLMQQLLTGKVRVKLPKGVA